MNHLMLDGWMPIILIGFVTTLVSLTLNKLLHRMTVYIISFLFFIVSISAFLYSLLIVGGWEGIAIGFYSISILIGNLLGFIIVTIQSNRHISKK